MQDSEPTCTALLFGDIMIMITLNASSNFESKSPAPCEGWMGSGRRWRMWTMQWFSGVHSGERRGGGGGEGDFLPNNNQHPTKKVNEKIINKNYEFIAWSYSFDFSLFLTIFELQIDFLSVCLFDCYLMVLLMDLSNQIWLKICQSRYLRNDWHGLKTIQKSCCLDGCFFPVFFW